MVVFLLGTTFANAEMITDIKSMKHTSITSIGVSLGGSVEEERSYIGYDINWDVSNRRWVYNFDLHMYSGMDTSTKKEVGYYTHVDQHNLGFMLTNRVKVFGVYRYEENDYQESLNHYQPGSGVSLYLLRKRRMQFEVFAGSVVDVVESQYYETEVIQRSLWGSSGYFIAKKSNLSANWYSWVLPSIENGDDFRVLTNIDIDVPIAQKLYFRSSLNHVYESMPIQAHYPDTRVTFGLVWSTRPSSL